MANRVRPTYEELYREHRATLKRLVQVTAQRDAAVRVSLAAKARHLRLAQEIDEDLARMQRERQEQETGHQLDRIAHEAPSAISVLE